MNDSRLVEIFQSFLTHRRKIGDEYTSMLLNHDDHRHSGPYYDELILPEFGHHAVRSLINNINRFTVQLCNMHGWQLAIQELESPDKDDICGEFLAPIAELLVLKPYSLRNQLIFNSCHLLEHHERFVRRAFIDNLPSDEGITFKTLEKLCSIHPIAVPLLGSIRKINQRNFVEQTNDFRNRATHRQPIELHRGLTGHITRTERSSIEYAHIPPLKIEALTPVLKDEIDYLRDAFIEFWNIAKMFMDEVKTPRR